MKTIHSLLALAVFGGIAATLAVAGANRAPATTAGSCCQIADCCPEKCCAANACCDSKAGCQSKDCKGSCGPK